MLATQYHFETLSSNQFYFTLKAGNNQEIAKSKIFETEETMHAFIGWIIGKRFSINLINEEDLDENLSISKNGNDPILTGIYSTQIDYFIFKGTNGKQYFSFKNKASKTLLLNTNVRGYENIETINKILSEVLQFAPNINNYDFKLTKNGKYYFYLKNIDSSNIAKSTFFATEEEMMEVIQLLTLAEMNVADSSENKDIHKKIGYQSDLFSEIDNNGKVKIDQSNVNKNLLINTPAQKEANIIKQPIEAKQENIETEQQADEDEFTALLKQQQQAELEVRLKREKEENERKAKQNQFAKANAAVLRKHKEEQSIELDDKIKHEDLVKSNEAPIASPKAKLELEKEILPLKKVKDVNKATTSETTKGPQPKINKERVDKATVVEKKTAEVAEANKKNKSTTTLEREVAKKQLLEKQAQSKKVKTKEVLPDKLSAKTKASTEKPALAEVKKEPEKPAEKEYDPEIEKAKIAAQARFDELKKAAKFRKRKEKEIEAPKAEAENLNEQVKKKEYDWWTKKEDSANEDVLLDADVNSDRELGLITMLKPALIGLLVVTLLFVGFRSFKSSNRNVAVVAETNDSQLTSASAISAGNNSVEKTYYNTTLPENFASVQKGSIEWYLINCIVNDNCPQEQAFQWIETSFQLNATYLSAQALQSLDNVARIMKEYANIRLEIYGHIAANEKDNFTSGKSLSEQRARLVKDLLVERGVSSDRLSFKGLAKTKPIQAGNSLTAHHQNKRIELILYKDQQSL